MSPGRARRLVGLLAGSFSVVQMATVSAQRVFAYSEPTVCTSFFKPVSGLTHHEGGAFNINWFITLPQYGPVDYHGVPDPAVSDDKARIWRNPTANATCFIDWYYLYPTSNMDASFRWHINSYGGIVTLCSGREELFEEDPGPGDPDGAWGGAG